MISWIKSELKDIDELNEEIGFKKSRLREVFVLYEKALKKNNAFDFDDLLEKPVKMFFS